MPFQKFGNVLAANHGLNVSAGAPSLTLGASPLSSLNEPRSDLGGVPACRGADSSSQCAASKSTPKIIFSISFHCSCASVLSGVDWNSSISLESSAFGLRRFGPRETQPRRLLSSALHYQRVKFVHLDSSVPLLCQIEVLVPGGFGAAADSRGGYFYQIWLAIARGGDAALQR
jgi:hypothetical protein